jgi:hypothetical protein
VFGYRGFTSTRPLIPAILNRTNYSGFSGVMASPYFLQATLVSNPSQVEFSIRFGF